MLLLVTGEQATLACGNTNLCAGLPAGSEGTVHAIQTCTTKPVPPLAPDSAPAADPAVSPTDANAASNEPMEALLTQPPDPPDDPPPQCQSPGSGAC